LIILINSDCIWDLKAWFWVLFAITIRLVSIACWVVYFWAWIYTILV